MFPKFTLPGLAASVLPLATALPVRVKACGELPALSLKTILPVAPLAVLGVNRTLTCASCPGLIVRGNEMPLTAKSVPETVAELIARFELPVFASVTV
jgi:hypothetical protein